MSFEEKVTWVSAAVTLMVAGAYFWMDDVDRKDERDARIEARGDRIGFYVLSALMIGVLAMAMLELPHFWIANGLFAAFVVSGLVSSTVRLVAYRLGF